jgi:prevent-host-death family protein
MFMEASISQFRRDLFNLVELAFSGEPVYVTHKGKRFRIVPDVKPGERLSKLTPLQIINPQFGELEDAVLKEEMAQAWENDWADL